MHTDHKLLLKPILIVANSLGNQYESVIMRWMFANCCQTILSQYWFYALQRCDTMILWINNNWARTGAYWISLIRTSFYWLLLAHNSSRSVRIASPRIRIESTPRPYRIALPPINHGQLHCIESHQASNTDWSETAANWTKCSHLHQSCFFPKSRNASHGNVWTGHLPASERELTWHFFW